VTPTQLCLIGHPVAHSLSPVFQQAALDAAGFAVRYTARDTEPHALADTLRALANDRAAGNVTIPHKEAVAAACARLTPVAQQVGAVNTFWHDERGALVGHNTDVAGARAAMQAVLAPSVRINAPLRVALLGAGGSAASVIVALMQFTNATLRITARSSARAELLVQRLGAHAVVVADVPSAVHQADLVINATPIGLRDDEMPVPPDALSPQTCVLDLVYKRGETAWVRACRERGLRAEDGLRMLVEQGAAAFESWFGVPPDRDAMWRVLEPRHASARP